MRWLVIVLLTITAIIVYFIIKIGSRGSLLCKYSDSPLVWSRGWKPYSKRTNPSLPDWYFEDSPTEERLTDRLNIEQIKQVFANLQGIIWFRTGSSSKGENDVTVFAKYLLPRLDHEVYLITTDGDLSIPGGLPRGVAEAILNNPYIIGWSTQNYDKTIVHPKLKHLPIGLDLHSHTRATNDKLVAIEQARILSAPWSKRDPRIFIDVLSKTHPVRQNIEDSLKGQAHIIFNSKRKPFDDSMKEYACYKFVASPRGNGLDCHRTWEVLLLGSVAIVQTSSLDDMYRGLPVIIIQDWKELLDPQCLTRFEKQHQDFMTRDYNIERFMNPSFWIDKTIYLSSVTT